MQQPYRRRFLKTALAVMAASPLVRVFAALEAGSADDLTVKVYAFIVKKRGLSDEEFHAHWREPHGRLTLKVPQIRRYVQNHGIGAVPTVPGLESTPYLGIATIWVDSPAELAQIYDDPGFVEVHEDELNLLEREQLRWFVSRETVVKPGPAERDKSARATKAILILERPEAESLPDFSQAVRAFAGQCRVLVPEAIAIKCSTVAPDGYAAGDDPFCDAIVELMFASPQQFRQSWSRHSERVLQAAAEFADLHASRGFLGTEERVLWPAPQS
jgi:uncharacterized protein (TIGR02118 family)